MHNVLLDEQLTRAPTPIHYRLLQAKRQIQLYQLLFKKRANKFNKVSSLKSNKQQNLSISSNLHVLSQNVDLSNVDAGLLLERRRLKSWLKIGIQISMARWSGLAEGGDITVACLPGLCLSSTAIWMSPYGGVVAYRLEWGATSYERARMHVCVPIYAPFQAAPCRNADFVGTETKGVGRESSCLWPMTRSPSLLDCNGVRLEHLSRAHISPCRGRWARNCRSNISHVAQRNN